MPKEITVKTNDAEGRELTFKLRSLTAGQRNDAIRKSTKTSYVGNKPTLDLDSTLFNEYCLSYSIFEPSGFHLDRVRSLDVIVFDKLVEELGHITEMSPSPKSDSERESLEGQLT